MKQQKIAINNRRYLGNKYRLLPFITKIVSENTKDITSFADLFAGTGVVSYVFTDKRLITNDILYSNYISNYAWFGTERYDKNKLINFISLFNSLIVQDDNYMSQTFGDTFFSRDDCKKIGYIREYIEKLYTQGEINFRERALLITSLIYAMDKIAKTCGHYDAYRKNVEFDTHIELMFPDASNDNLSNECYNEDINILAPKIYADIVYLDPPYNSRQYCDCYHVLENVARWEKPEVRGIARKMDRTKLKSSYCTNKAPEVFKDLIEKINARYILLSYNNMSNKGDSRSNAKISDDDIMNILSQKGDVSVFSESYKAFTAGKSNIEDNSERLFLCVCR